MASGFSDLMQKFEKGVGNGLGVGDVIDRLVDFCARGDRLAVGLRRTGRDGLTVSGLTDKKIRL